LASIAGATLRRHWSEEQIVVGEKYLVPLGWNAGEHKRD